MLTLSFLGEQIAAQRKKLGLTQTKLARKAFLSRDTLDTLENGRTREVGFSKITKLLSALGLERGSAPVSPACEPTEQLIRRKGGPTRSNAYLD